MFFQSYFVESSLIIFGQIFILLVFMRCHYFSQDENLVTPTVESTDLWLRSPNQISDFDLRQSLWSLICGFEVGRFLPFFD